MEYIIIYLKAFNNYLKMPSLSYDIIKNIQDISSYPIFVETGSYMGETIFHMENTLENYIQLKLKNPFMII